LDRRAGSLGPQSPNPFVRRDMKLVFSDRRGNVGYLGGAGMERKK
jgi:hypothetical protein